MANTDTPFGAKPVKHLNGSPWNGKANVYYVPAAENTMALFIGDFVKSAGSADATGKYPTVTAGTATAAIRGVIIGMGDNPYTMTHPDTPNRNYRPLQTEMYVWVVDDPQVIFEIQEDSVAGSIAYASVGLSCDFTAGAGSTTTGRSAHEVDSSEVNTTGQLRLLRIVNREDNELGNYCKWEVLIGEHELANTIATGIA